MFFRSFRPFYSCLPDSFAYKCTSYLHIHPNSFPPQRCLRITPSSAYSRGTSSGPNPIQTPRQFLTHRRQTYTAVLHTHFSSLIILTCVRSYGLDVLIRACRNQSSRTPSLVISLFTATSQSKLPRPRQEDNLAHSSFALLPSVNSTPTTQTPSRLSPSPCTTSKSRTS